MCLIFIFLLLLPQQIFPTSIGQLKTLYNSLDPYSLSQHLAFYELYSDTTYGKEALQIGEKLLVGSKTTLPPSFFSISLSPSAIQGIITLVNKLPGEEIPLLSEKDLFTIESIAHTLNNRRLKGHGVNSEEELLSLTPDEIDLARALFLSELGNDPLTMQKIRTYEAYLDLMALQIRSRLSQKTQPIEKIDKMNRFIFEELGFRFPPHSLWSKEVDQYTFLPTVLDSRRGVCLGVSILYICLAQRLDLALEVVTPPGHIFVRWREGDQVINIETTARGIHLESEEYLGIETPSLRKRNVKEVVGLAHFNQAAVYWHRKEPEKAVNAYLKAFPYLKDDYLLKQFLALNYLFMGNREAGEELLREIKDEVPEDTLRPSTLIEDYLNGEIDAISLQETLSPLEETRSSLLQKRELLEKIIERYPKFRAGLMSLAGIWLQLHREREALELLKQYHKIDDQDLGVEYYLAALYAERLDFRKAWEHLHQAEKLAQESGYYPKPLKELRIGLKVVVPE